MSFLVVLILSIRLPFSKHSSKFVKEGYETLSFSTPTGKFADTNYINKHKITSFSYTSDGDKSNYPISNAFDDKIGTYWVSGLPENETYHPSISINFSTPVLLEAFLYDTAYHTPDKNSNRVFDGFPGRLKVYTSIDDEPFTLNSIFTGTLLYSWSRIQFALSTPVNCSRLQLVFYDVSPATSLKFEEKLAATGGLTLIQNFGYDELELQPADGNYIDGNYLDFHTIKNGFNYTCTGSRNGNDLEKAFDSVASSYWVSDRPETDDFKPSITVTFDKPLFLEAFLYDTAYRTAEPNRYFDGFPSTFKIYTSLNDDPLQIHTVFTGTPVYPAKRIQYLFSRPIKLTKIKFEFCDVSAANSLSSTEKLAVVGNLILLQSFEEGVGINEASGKYVDSYYLSTHTIPTSNFTYNSTGDMPDHPISEAFDSVVKSHWVSNFENTDDFHATITANFTEPVDLEAILLYAAFHSAGTKRVFDGYPIKFRVLTAIDDEEPLKESALFVGSPVYPWKTIQFVLPNPVRCKRVQLEFVEVTPETVFSNGAKKACVSGIYFIRHFEYDYTTFEVANGYYVDKGYLANHLVPLEDIKYSSTGDLAGHSIQFAFDSKYADSWVSSVESTEENHASIFVNFTNTVLLEAMIYEGGFQTDSTTKQRVFIGFPLKLIIHAALNDETLSPKAFFIGKDEPPTTKYQFVLPNPIPCDRIQIEFVEVTPENAFSGKKRCPLAHQIDFLASPFEEITGTIEGDFSPIYVNKSYVKDGINNADFANINLPKDEEYIMVVTKDQEFDFINDSFVLMTNRAGAIKGNMSSKITVRNCSFVSCSNKNVQENGGAINIKNCGLELDLSDFKDTSSSGGCGGSIYVVIDQPLENDFTINECNFTNSSALYGGAAYIYSSVESIVITLNKCSFISNKARADKSQGKLQSGGSAVFLVVKKSEVIYCRFSRNQGPGGALKIIDNFNDESLSLLLSKNKKSVLVKNCFFEIDFDSTSSISYHRDAHAKRSFVSVSVDRCTFTGELNEGAHHISGENAGKMFNVELCKFSYGKEKAVNENFNGLFDVRKQEFYFGQSIDEQQKVRKSGNDHAGLLLMTSAICAAVLLIIIVVTIIVKKNNNPLTNDDPLEI